MTTRLVGSGRARLATEVRGAGPTVLLLHAGVTDRRSWHHVVDRLSPTHRCLAFDARGFGETEHEPEDGWAPVSDAVAVLDAHEADTAVVVGGSMGGRTALDLALTHPERVRGLVLIGTAVSGAPAPTLDPLVAELDARLEAAEEAGDLAEVNRLEARLWLDGPGVAEGRVAGRARELFLDMNARALAAVDPGPEAPRPATWDRLDEIRVPTLVLVGEHDLPHIHESSRRIVDHASDAALVELPGVAHLPQVEGDPRTLEEIAAFVARL